ncbi:hypothetical protein JOF41_006455 [Saccharothrix coeruleofusca]|uniref:hypothetical protein n=1 Tax=Saccharothrix coeruleofusca TaxID=33919 RepID=UPI001AE50439|nr:hypothetical protein [Saccharothrix coeruleofusca]MBP2340277.1 hypothetical protein [Saccharothrix coeruleofusca]
MSNNLHRRDLVDVRTGDTFIQPTPYGPVIPVTTADGSAPSSQRGRSWEYLTASGRVLRPIGGA